jgi:phospholipid-binding lipoprotein MlaA
MSSQTRTQLLLVSALFITVLSGCASLPKNTQHDPRDPFERYNRAVFSFNRGLDRTVARPIAVGYTKITPRPVRLGISNFLANLSYPVVMVNDLLQVKVVHFGRDTARFVVNTTVGLGGLFDPATRWGLEANNEDLGQTLGSWGVPPGAYLMLPILGSATVRDGIGDVGDNFLEPRTYISDSDLQLGLTGLDLLDTRAGLLDTDAALNEAFDPYAFVRNAYLQRREYLIQDGNISDDEPVDESDASPGETATP